MSMTKATSLQSYHMLLFRNALHPEFFQIDARRRITHGEYDFEAWIFPGGHVLRFEHNGLCASEAVTCEPETLPDRGLVTSVPCAGERDSESEFSDRILYMNSMQTETLTDHLFLGTFKEMREHAGDGNGLLTSWDDADGRSNMSLIDMQRYADEVHVQGYHLRSDCGLVLRTQSIFQLKRPE